MTVFVTAYSDISSIPDFDRDLEAKRNNTSTLSGSTTVSVPGQSFDRDTGEYSETYVVVVRLTRDQLRQGVSLLPDGTIFESGGFPLLGFEDASVSVARLNQAVRYNIEDGAAYLGPRGDVLEGGAGGTISVLQDTEVKQDNPNYVGNITTVTGDFPVQPTETIRSIPDASGQTTVVGSKEYLDEYYLTFEMSGPFGQSAFDYYQSQVDLLVAIGDPEGQRDAIWGDWLQSLDVNDLPQGGLRDDPDNEALSGDFVDINVFQNDTLVDGAALIDFSQGANGDVEYLGEGVFRYTADDGFQGADTFTYTVAFPGAPTQTAVVSVNVTPDPNSRITDAIDDVFGPAQREGDYYFFNVFDNDTVANGTLILSALPFSQPGSGQLETNATISFGPLTDGRFGSFRYLPEEGFTGPVEFTYTIEDSEGTRDTATVTINVSQPVQPEAVFDPFQFENDGLPSTLDVLENDKPMDGSLTIVSVSFPEHGIAEIINNELVYTPDAGFAGFDFFSYEISTPDGLTASADISVELLYEDEDGDGREDWAPDAPDASIDTPAEVDDYINQELIREDETEARGWESVDASDIFGPSPPPGTEDIFLFSSREYEIDEVAGTWNVLDGNVTSNPSGPDPSTLFKLVGDSLASGAFAAISTTLKANGQPTIGGAGSSATQALGLFDALSQYFTSMTSLLAEATNSEFGTFDFESTNEKIDQNVDKLLGDAVSTVPIVGPLLRDLYFSSQHSNVSFELSKGPGSSVGQEHSDRQFMGSGDDGFDGGDNDDVLFGMEGDDFLIGGNGNDIIDGGKEDDLLLGGFGNDQIYGGTGSDRIEGDDGRDLIWGASGKDTLLGGDGDDDIEGGNGSDSLAGGSGQDYLLGGAGKDTLSGGDGWDNLVGGLGSDVIDGGHGIDRLRFFEVPLTRGAEVNLGLGFSEDEGGRDTISNIEQVIGSDFDDTITGDVGDNYLEGRIGDDTVSGAAGNDEVNGGSGSDFLRGGRGQDTLEGDFGDDSLRGQREADLLDGGSGDDNLKGGGGNDTLQGRSGNDFLKGGSRRDSIFGGDDDDKLSGNSFDDLLDGGAGDDKLIAGGQNDTLIGGVGDDFLKGGSGADTFVFNPGDGVDTFDDFTFGEDLLQLGDFGLSAQEIEDRAVVVEGDLVIAFSATESITMRGTTSSDGLAESILFG